MVFAWTYRKARYPADGKAGHFCILFTARMTTQRAISFTCTGKNARLTVARRHMPGDSEELVLLVAFSAD